MKALIASSAAAESADAGGASGGRLPKSFEGFRFSGKLRPGVVTPRKAMPDSIRKPDYAVTGVPRSEDAIRGGDNSIHKHTAAEAEMARVAGRLAREVLDAAAAHLTPGATGEDIDRVVMAACIERNVYPSPLNYRGFPKSVCV